MAQVHLAVARGLGGFNKLVVLKRLEAEQQAERTRSARVRGALGQGKEGVWLADGNPRRSTIGLVRRVEGDRPGGPDWLAPTQAARRPISSSMRNQKDARPPRPSGHCSPSRVCPDPFGRAPPAQRPRSRHTDVGIRSADAGVRHRGQRKRPRSATDTNTAPCRLGSSHAGTSGRVGGAGETPPERRRHCLHRSKADTRSLGARLARGPETSPRLAGGAATSKSGG